MARIRTTFGKVCFKVALFLEINVDFIVPGKLKNVVNFFFFCLIFQGNCGISCASCIVRTER